MEPDKIEFATLDVWLGTKKTCFTAPYSDGGNIKTEAVRKIEAEFILSNAVFLLEDEVEKNRYTFLSNSGHNSRPGLSLAHTANADDLSTANPDCLSGRGHKIIKLA
jgi:hypothetical protein